MLTLPDAIVAVLLPFSTLFTTPLGRRLNFCWWVRS